MFITKDSIAISYDFVMWRSRWFCSLTETQLEGDVGILSKHSNNVNSPVKYIIILKKWMRVFAFVVPVSM